MEQGGQAEGAAGAAGAGAEEITPEQQEMLRRMEEEMRNVRVQDVITQSVVSILNLAARRIAKDDERDLEQGRLGIEAVRALIDMLEEEPAREVRNALSQVQMLYAQHAGEGGGGEAGGSAGEAPAGEGGAPHGGGEDEPGSGGQDRPASRLWTPGS
jgi:hypothetical protein